MAKDKEENGSRPGIMSDPRFAHLVNDPRYKRLPKAQRKVKIDKRFQSMFESDRFKVQYTVGKRGEKLNKTTSEDLKKYYDISTDESDLEEELKKEQKAIEEQEESESENEKAVEEFDEFGNSVLVADDSNLSKDVKEKLKNLEVDYARGEGVLMSDSSSDEESSEDENELVLDHVWGELDADAPRTEESTKRIAACNMDWDRIRAVDIMVMCHSFLPPGGVIKKVSVFPSEFGKERMKEEEIVGPRELVEEDPSDSENSEIEAKDEDAEESEYHREKLRQYQLNRLKYFYAVIECDSVATADKLYAECDGLEYESTANKLDFRFIPDDVTFDEDEPRDVCDELPDLSKYQPRIFTTKALQQGKVELTWDENDVERQEVQEKLLSGDLKNVPDMLLKRYVACSSSDEDEVEDQHKNGSEQDSGSESEKEIKKAGKHKGRTIDKYKAILSDINKKEEEQKAQQIERELTWGIGVESDILDKKVQKVKQEQTPFEKIIEKKKEKRKARKEEIKRRKKLNDDSESDDDLPSDIDMNDPYFAEEFQNGEFAPLATKKKSKQNKIKQTEESDPEEVERKNKELSLLLEDPDDANRSHFSLKKIQEAEDDLKTKKKRKFKKKKKNEKLLEDTKLQDDFKLNVDDDRFKAVFTEPEFNIDPTNPQFKKTKNMETIIQEKLKRKADNDGFANDSKHLKKQSKMDPEVSLLMKNIKRKIMKQ